jgi:hypothetical protein
MPSPNHLQFEKDAAGELMVHSSKYRGRRGPARQIMRTGKWLSGETMTASDAIIIARKLVPDRVVKRVVPHRS